MSKHNTLTKREPDIGGFVIRAVKAIRDLNYRDFEEYGYGTNTVPNWATGLAKGGFADVLDIVEYYEVDINEALSTAKLFQQQYREMKRQQMEKEKAAIRQQ